MISFLKNLGLFALGFFRKAEEDFTKAVRLPLGMTEFHTWSESIIEKSGLPKNDSMKHAIAKAIQRLGTEISEVPKAYFVSILHSAAAKQVAFAFADDFMAKKQQEIASNAAKPVESVVATTPPSGS